MSQQMERLLEQAGQKAPKQKRILELNPDHALLSKMNTLHIADEKEKLVRYAELVYGQALLAEGSPLPDPVAFNALLTEVMVGG
jgi:molecular chaperone HtpG